MKNGAYRLTLISRLILAAVFAISIVQIFVPRGVLAAPISLIQSYTASHCNNCTSQSRAFDSSNIAGGANTVTITISPTAASVGLSIHEYSGLATTNTLDVSAGQVAPNSTNQWTTPSIHTNYANELLMAGFEDFNGFGPITASG